MIYFAFCNTTNVTAVHKADTDEQVREVPPEDSAVRSCGNWVGVLLICVLVFTVFLYCFVYAYLFLFVTGVRTTATE